MTSKVAAVLTVQDFVSVCLTSSSGLSAPQKQGQYLFFLWLPQYSSPVLGLEWVFHNFFHLPGLFLSFFLLEMEGLRSALGALEGLSCSLA